MNRQKYRQAFLDTFQISDDMLEGDLGYESIPAWDSVGHMALISALEDEFGIVMDMDDVVDFSSYSVGMRLLEKYGIQIEG